MLPSGRWALSASAGAPFALPIVIALQFTPMRCRCSPAVARACWTIRLVNEFASLERKTTSLGRDKIDHGPGGNDDLANAAALSMVLAATEKKPMTFHVPFVATAPSYFRSFESGAPMAAGLFDGGSSGQPGGSELPSNAEARRQATERLNRT
jgi:hypothetical protein